MQLDGWIVGLNLRFLIMFSLVLAGFLPITISIYSTWQEDKKHAKKQDRK